MSRLLALAGAALVAAACGDPTSPPSADSHAAEQLTAPRLFARYVALGTSNSMGVQSAGIFAAGQEAGWPARLAARVGVPFSLPIVEEPGCGPPLLAPLAADFALVGAFAALGAEGDLVSAVATTCAPLRAGLTLPANNVAISGADVHDALHATVESKTAFSARVGTLYSRVLPPGQTQVTAMLAQQPTFVSVELAANDVLPASSGLVSAMTPYDDWARDFDEVIAAVRSTGARAVLVGLPTSSAGFPSVRRAGEFFDEWPFLRALGITVSDDCARSPNHLFLPGYVLTLLARTPTTATCTDVPGAEDYVLTPGDIAAIDERMARINAHIQARASEHGYAYFALSSLYDLPKPPFDLRDVLFSSTPFGANMSLDGVHPSALGQGILAEAAALAIGATYGLAIP
jgi:hypothetical protein